MRVSMFTDVVTKHDIVRALEEGTWAELRVRDWDLSRASSLTAPPRTFVFKADGVWLAGTATGPGTLAWAGLLAAIKDGVPTGLRLFGTSDHARTHTRARSRKHTPTDTRVHTS
jgi:hypothetical protein